MRIAPVEGVTGRSVLSLRHHPAAGVAEVLALAARIKAHPRPWPALLADRTIGLIFEKPSTRTRVSLETGIARLGATPLILAASDLQIGRGETIEDTALVLSRYVDAIVIRSGSHERVEELARHASVPVINALTPLHHPCQALADAQTLIERFGELRDLPVAYVGDGNNVFHSLAIVAAHTGMRLTCASPEGYTPDAEIVAWADATARERDGWVRVVSDPREAVADAKAVYTDVWISMGDEDERDARLEALAGHQVNADLMAGAASDAVVLHCLPAHYGEEITHDVAHGPRSALWDQAENRLHSQAALLALVLAD